MGKSLTDRRPDRGGLPGARGFPLELVGTPPDLGGPPWSRGPTGALCFQQLHQCNWQDHNYYQEPGFRPSRLRGFESQFSDLLATNWVQTPDLLLLLPSGASGDLSFVVVELGINNNASLKHCLFQLAICLDRLNTIVLQKQTLEAGYPWPKMSKPMLNEKQEGSIRLFIDD